jgi:hypothetical protein
MVNRLEIPGADDGLTWRCITIGANDAHGSIGRRLQEEYERQHGYKKALVVEIHRRKNNDGGYTFVFSPRAAIEAGDRLKGIGLVSLKASAAGELLADDRFSRTAVD